MGSLSDVHMENRQYVPEGRPECLCDSSVTEPALGFLSQPQSVDLVWVSGRKFSFWTSSARHTLGPGTHFLCAQDSPGLLMKGADPDTGDPGGSKNLHTDHLLGILLQRAYRSCLEKPRADYGTASP